MVGRGIQRVSTIAKTYVDMLETGDRKDRKDGAAKEGRAETKKAQETKRKHANCDHDTCVLCVRYKNLIGEDKRRRKKKRKSQMFAI